MYEIIYFSTRSGNTHKFVGKLGFNTRRIPLSPKSPMIETDVPYILVLPTYADDQGRGAVAKQVIKFLNNESNRDLMVGVIAGGNANFGKYYGYAGNVISKKCGVPLLYKFELAGSDTDVNNVKQGVSKLWDQHNQQRMRA